MHSDSTRKVNMSSTSSKKTESSTINHPVISTIKKNKRKPKPNRKKSKTTVAVDGSSVPNVKIPASKTEASNNWKILLSQKSIDAFPDKGRQPQPYFFRRGQKINEKSGKTNSEEDSKISNPTTSQMDEGEASSSVAQGKSSRSGDHDRKALPKLTNLNTLGCFDYSHYGHLRTVITTEHKYLTEPTPALAIDCEMVGVGPLKENALARVSVVNEFGYCLYDKFVKQKVNVTDYRTEFSGVREEDLKTAEEFQSVLTAVADLIKGRFLVGHSLKSDLDVLFLKHPNMKIRDTALYYKKRFKKPKTPSLKTLANDYLNVQIQAGEHSSITDAQAAMKVYLFCREEWEDSVHQKYNIRLHKYWYSRDYKMAVAAIGGHKSNKVKRLVSS